MRSHVPPRFTHSDTQRYNKLLPRHLRKRLGTRMAFWWEGFIIGVALTATIFLLIQHYNT